MSPSALCRTPRAARPPCVLEGLFAGTRIERRQEKVPKRVNHGGQI
jgi:hypothetical protein